MTPFSVIPCDEDELVYLGRIPHGRIEPDEKGWPHFTYPAARSGLRRVWQVAFLRVADELRAVVMAWAKAVCENDSGLVMSRTPTAYASPCGVRAVGKRCDRPLERPCPAMSLIDDVFTSIETDKKATEEIAALIAAGQQQIEAAKGGGRSA